MKNYILIILSSILISYQCYSQIPTTSLVGYYPFTGNTNDLSGFGNNGTVSGATLTTDRFGNANSAYYFNGAANIAITNSKQTDIESWSLSVWYLTTSVGNLNRISSKQLSNNGTNYISLIMSSGILYGSAYNGSNEIQIRDTRNTNDGSWHNAVYIRDNVGNKYYLYVDNIAKDTIIDVFGTLTNTGNLFFGSAYQGSQYWNGKIDDIRIYNRVISTTEIASLYNEGICAEKITVTDTLRISAVTGYNSLPSIFGFVKIYPNPAKNLLNIAVSSPSSSYNLNITNSLSTSVYSTTLNGNSFQVNLSGYTAGVYYVQILDTSNNILETKKLVIE